MSYTIEAVEGIGPSYAKKLSQANVKTTAQLLKLCCDKRGRKSVAEQSGISEKLILTWVNLADLMRIKGIGPQFSELLEAAGVDTVKELATRRPDNLAAKMSEVNAAKRLTRSTPSEKQVTEWVALAKTMDPVITQ